MGLDVALPLLRTREQERGVQCCCSGLAAAVPDAPAQAALGTRHETAKLLIDLRSLVEQHLRHDTVSSLGGYHQRSHTVIPLGTTSAPLSSSSRTTSTLPFWAA